MAFAEWAQRHQGNAVLASLIGSLVACLVATGSAVVTYRSGIAAQDRQLRIEQISKFDQSSGQLIENAGEFIAAINGKNDLTPVRVKFNAVLAAQANAAEQLKNVLNPRNTRPFDAYDTALDELRQTIRSTSTVTEMRPWSESFGRVLDAKADISRKLFADLGVRPSGKP